MATLSEDKFIIAQKYAGFLETIEEAFEYMLVCFKDLRFEVVEELWNGILNAFSQIDRSNSIVSEEFADSPALLMKYAQFEDVLGAVEATESDDNLMIIQQIIHNKIFKVFLAWKEQVEQELIPYYII